MNAETINDVIEKLIGKVEPYADSQIDSERLQNMETYIEVFQKMHSVIDDIAYRYKNSRYASAKKIGELAAKQLDSMGISE